MNQRDFFQKRDQLIREKLLHQTRSTDYMKMFHSVSSARFQVNTWSGRNYSFAFDFRSNPGLQSIFQDFLQHLSEYESKQMHDASKKLADHENEFPQFLDKV